VAELQQGRELADADEAANDAAGVASAATDDSDRLVAELRERLADAERRQHQAAAQASTAPKFFEACMSLQNAMSSRIG